jgi:hypothetical protein
MNALSTALVIVVGSITLIGMLSAISYRIWLLPSVRAWFGEEEGYRRGNREARARRTSFERRCGYAIMSLFGSIVPGTFKVMMADRLPEVARWGLIMQVAMLVIGGLFIWLAIHRWKNPLED